MEYFTPGVLNVLCGLFLLWCRTQWFAVRKSASSFCSMHVIPLYSGVQKTETNETRKNACRTCRFVLLWQAYRIRICVVLKMWAHFLFSFLFLNALIQRLLIWQTEVSDHCMSATACIFFKYIVIGVSPRGYHLLFSFFVLFSFIFFNFMM